MKKIFILAVSMICFNSFAMEKTHHFSPWKLTDSDIFNKAATIRDLEKILNQAEDDAPTVEGRKILETARIMITNQEVVLGSCWDYINALYNRTGFPSKFRATVFKSKLVGPYVQVQQNIINQGDWLYFINHSYNNVEHSGVFVAWTNLAKNEALIISYAGGNQAKPARYKIYDLSSVYNIMRPR